MSEQEENQIEKEVQTRLTFKINELINNIHNTIKLNKSLGLYYIMEQNNPQLSQKHTHYQEAFELFNSILNKELSVLPVPYDNMTAKSTHDQKNKAVEKIVQKLDELTKGKISYQQRANFAQSVAAAVEKAQNIN